MTRNRKWTRLLRQQEEQVDSQIQWQKKVLKEDREAEKGTKNES